MSYNNQAVAETAPTFLTAGARMLSVAYRPHGRSAIGPFGLEAAHAAGTGNGLVIGRRLHGPTRIVLRSRPEEQHQRYGGMVVQRNLHGKVSA